MHTIAYRSAGRPGWTLAKCGRVVPAVEAQAFDPTCVDCADPGRWPTEVERVAYDGTRKA